MQNLNQKDDRPNRQILTGLILGWGLQGLFSLPALAQPSLPESPAAIENQAQRTPTAISVIAVEAPETILPENQQFVDRSIPPSTPSLPQSSPTPATLAEPAPTEIAVDSLQKILVYLNLQQLLKTRVNQSQRKAQNKLHLSLNSAM
jgi:hypothetical protein